MSVKKERGMFMSVIKIKRGLSKDLNTPVLGEPAFTIDEKALYVGDGSTHCRIGPFGSNLLANGNFQVPGLGTYNAYASPSLPVYFGGLYKFYSEAGNSTLTIQSPTSQAPGMLTLTPNYPVPVQIEYNIPYTSLGGIVSRPYEGASLMLSFDLDIPQSGTLEYGVSGGAVLSKSYAAGKQRLYCPIPSWSDSGLNSRYFSLLIADFKPNVSSAFKIGNIKLERGTIATPFVPNSVGYDSSIISQYFTRIIGLFRLSYYDPDNVYFGVPYVYNLDFVDLRKFSLSSSCNVRRVGGGAGVISGDVASMYLPERAEPVVRFAKTAHGLTDACAYIDLSIDYRK